MKIQLIIFLFINLSFLKSSQDTIDIYGDNKFGFTQKINNLADTTTSLLYNKKMQASLMKRDTMAVFDMYCFGKDVGERNPKIGLITADSILSIAKEINDIRGIISGYNLRGLMYTITDEYEKALHYLNKSLDVANSNLTNNYKRIIDKHSITYYYIGSLYSKRGEHDEALTQYLKALSIINKLSVRDYEIEDSLIKNLWGRFPYTTYKNDKLEIMYAIANTQSILKNYDSSNNYLDSCLNFEGNYTDHNLIAKIEYLKGNNLYSTGNESEALRNLDKALEVSNYMKNHEYIIKSNLLYFNIKNNPSFLQDALTSAKIIKSIKDEADIYLQLSNYYQSIEDFKSSNIYLNQHLSLLKKINSEESERKFGKLESDLEYKFKLRTLEQEKQLAETERKLASQRVLILVSTIVLGLIILVVVARLYFQKRQYISIIESKQTELESLNQQLKELNLSKIKLFGIISHDLKSPIREFEIGTKNLLKYDDGSSLSPESQSNIEYLNQLSLKISKLLVSLLDWSKSQIEPNVSNNEANCNINDIINEIIELYSHDINRKSLSINSKIKYQDINYNENDIRIVFRNILQNAIKFSNLNSSIVIDNYIEDEYLIITIENDGNPISDSNLSKIENLELPYVQQGIQFEPGTGLGLIKVNEILNNIGGNLILENTRTGVIAFIYLKYT